MLADDRQASASSHRWREAVFGCGLVAIMFFAETP